MTLRFIQVAWGRAEDDPGDGDGPENGVGNAEVAAVCRLLSAAAATDLNRRANLYIAEWNGYGKQADDT